MGCIAHGVTEEAAMRKVQPEIDKLLAKWRGET